VGRVTTESEGVMTVSKRLRFEILRRDEFRYFCGCAWRRVTEAQERACQILADEVD
jgi:hypothetical protein